MIIKENYYNEYRDFNKTIIFLAISMIFLPLIVYPLRIIFPDMIRCIYYEITGNPCPFCGFTTDMSNILKGNFFVYKYNYLSIPLLIIGIVEVITRIKLIKINTNSKLKKIIKWDIGIHIIVFISLIIYEISFFVFDLSRF